jgi:pimeloyl-ACP methyl ester carboxylesterase
MARGRWLMLIVAVTLGALLLAIAVLAVTQAVLSRAARERFNPPGRLIDVGGYSLHAYCTGPGTPSVLLEAGAGSFSLAWRPVQRALVNAGIAVCSYDRAGLGWSDASPKAQGVADEADALAAALGRLDVARELIVVGHSYGGFVAPMLASRHRSRVSGLVLVEPNTVEYFTGHPEALRFARWGGRALSWLGPLGLLRPFLAGQIRSKAPRSMAGHVDALVGLGLSTRGLRALGRSTFAFADSLAALRAMVWPQDLPVVVISRGRDDAGWAGGNREADWRRAHRNLVASIAGAKLVVAERSSHDVPWTQPKIIVEVVRELLQANASDDPSH